MHKMNSNTVRRQVCRIGRLRLGHGVGRPPQVLVRCLNTQAKTAGHPQEIEMQEQMHNELPAKVQTEGRRPLHPIHLVSEYGDLLHLRPYARARTHKTGKADLREVKIIGDNTDSKTLLKQLNANPTAHFLFDPSKGHYSNARSLYLALKRQLEQRHYGHLDKKQTEKLEL